MFLLKIKGKAKMSKAITMLSRGNAAEWKPLVNCVIPIIHVVVMVAESCRDIWPFLVKPSSLWLWTYEEMAYCLPSGHGMLTAISRKV